MSKNSYLIWAIAVFTAFGQPIVAQELQGLNLPKSGLTESSIRSQEELIARMMQLTTCSGCGYIINGKKYDGSDDYINLGVDGANIVVNGYSFRFDWLSFDGDMLPGCQRYLSGKIDSGPSGTSGSWMTETLAFTFTGAEASLAPEGNIIELKTEIIWPSDPLKVDLPEKAFVAGEQTILLPFLGQSGEGLVSKINELSQICQDLGWQ